MLLTDGLIQYLARLSFSGVHVGNCGVAAIRVRPTLTVQRKHVDVFLDVFRGVLMDFK